MNAERCRAAGRIGDVLTLACWVTALGGAVYFGLASCGTYAWHKIAFRWLASLLYVLALVLPGHGSTKPGARLRFALGLPLSYVLLESAVAPFYPGLPELLTEYLQLFVTALAFGPCS